MIHCTSITYLEVPLKRPSIGCGELLRGESATIEKSERSLNATFCCLNPSTNSFRITNRQNKPAVCESAGLRICRPATLSFANPLLVVMPDDADHFPDDFGVFIHGYGFVFWILRREMNDPGFADEALNRRFVLGDAGDHDVAVLG